VEPLEGDQGRTGDGRIGDCDPCEEGRYEGAYDGGSLIGGRIVGAVSRTEGALDMGRDATDG